MTTEKYRKAFENLVNKLETIQEDDYVQNLHRYVCSLWSSELKEAKSVINEDKNPVVLCKSEVQDTDLFDRPMKDELEP